MDLAERGAIVFKDLINLDNAVVMNGMAWVIPAVCDWNGTVRRAMSRGYDRLLGLACHPKRT